MIDLRAAFISIFIVGLFLLSLKAISFIHKLYTTYIQLNLLVWQNLYKGHNLTDAKNKAVDEIKKIMKFAKEYQ